MVKRTHVTCTIVYESDVLVECDEEMDAAEAVEAILQKDSSLIDEIYSCGDCTTDCKVIDLSPDTYDLGGRKWMLSNRVDALDVDSSSIE